jgi:uncharacterized membrane protein
VGWAITFAVIAAFVVLITNPKRLLKEAPEVNPPMQWWHLTLYFLVGILGISLLMPSRSKERSI